jgi:hypothetical protein
MLPSRAVSSPYDGFSKAGIAAPTLTRVMSRDRNSASSGLRAYSAVAPKREGPRVLRVQPPKRSRGRSDLD